MLVTSKEIKMNFRGYDIIIPKGTRTTHQTAIGIDEKYNFIDDFSWIPSGQSLLKHDAVHYGIDIPAKHLKEQLYKVVKVFRVSLRRKVLNRNLTLEEAQRIVRSYPDSSRSMIVFSKQ